MTSSLALSPEAGQRRPSRRTTNLVLLALAIIVPLSWVIWFVNTPPDLTTNTRQASGTSVAGTTLHVGMYNAPSGFDRTIRVIGVKVAARSSAPVDITPMLCRDGAVGVTTRPEQFCRDLVAIEGEQFGNTDSIVLRVESEDAAKVEIERIRVGFQQDLRSTTSSAGIAGASLTFGTPSP